MNTHLHPVDALQFGKNSYSRLEEGVKTREGVVIPIGTLCGRIAWGLPRRVLVEGRPGSRHDDTVLFASYIAMIGMGRNPGSQTFLRHDSGQYDVTHHARQVWEDQLDRGPRAISPDVSALVDAMRESITAGGRELNDSQLSFMAKTALRLDTAVASRSRP